MFQGAFLSLLAIFFFSKQHFQRGGFQKAQKPFSPPFLIHFVGIFRVVVAKIRTYVHSADKSAIFKFNP